MKIKSLHVRILQSLKSWLISNNMQPIDGIEQMSSFLLKYIFYLQATKTTISSTANAQWKDKLIKFLSYKDEIWLSKRWFFIIFKSLGEQELRSLLQFKVKISISICRKK